MTHIQWIPTQWEHTDETTGLHVVVRHLADSRLIDWRVTSKDGEVLACCYETDATAAFTAAGAAFDVEMGKVGR